MKLHANAPLSPKGRQLLIDRIEIESQLVRQAAQSLGISERTARKWLARYRAEGPAGLIDRSSAPKVVANRSDEQTVRVIAALRRLRFARRRSPRSSTAVVDGVGNPHADPDGQARPPRSRAG